MRTRKRKRTDEEFARLAYKLRLAIACSPTPPTTGTIATLAQVNPETTAEVLSELLLAGLVSQVGDGWRLERPEVTDETEPAIEEATEPAIETAIEI
jgi:hypothetical protein